MKSNQSVSGEWRLILDNDRYSDTIGENVTGFYKIFPAVYKKAKITGTVTDIKMQGTDSKVFIQSDNGTKYFAHIGDIRENEMKLKDSIPLKVKDRVCFEEFTPNTHLAIHVEIKNDKT